MPDQNVELWEGGKEGREVFQDDRCQHSYFPRLWWCRGLLLIGNAGNQLAGIISFHGSTVGRQTDKTDDNEIVQFRQVFCGAHGVATMIGIGGQVRRDKGNNSEVVEGRPFAKVYLVYDSEALKMEQRADLFRVPYIHRPLHRCGLNPATGRTGTKTEKDRQDSTAQHSEHSTAQHS